MPGKGTKTFGFNKFGYGALALYATMIVVASQSNSDRARAKVKTGRMVIGTEDRVQCRSLNFNNETQELSAETLAECDQRFIGSPGGSFGIFRDGFVNR